MINEFIHNVLPLIVVLLAGLVGAVWGVFYK
jgi:hypothetical protein